MADRMIPGCTANGAKSFFWYVPTCEPWAAMLASI